MTVTVMGIGRFGGGVGVVRHLLDRGCRVIATDLLDEASLAEVVAQLRAHPAADRLELRLGRHETRDFTEADLVVANPAVPRPSESAFLNAARERGVPITTEIRLAVDALPKRRFVGVTGSSGKSSTASMIHHALGQLGVPTALGGNIGGSLLDEAPNISDRAWVVLELSSFMLHWLGEDRRPWSPQLAVLTNLSPNHLDWHGDLRSYIRAKSQIVAHRAASRLLT
ncbi:MAG: Mur ligase family protein, partial [Phycisphaerales bacterium]